MPAAKILLSWVNHVDTLGVTFSASQEAGDNSATNLASPIIGRRWRTTVTFPHVDIDLGSNKTIGVLALRFPRDTETFSDVVSIRHDLDAEGGTPGTGAVYSDIVNSNVTDDYGYHAHVLSSAQTARYWRVTLASNSDFTDIGRAWAGEAWRPTFNIGLGYEDTWADLSRVSASNRSGAEFVDERARQRLFAFGLNALSESERDEIREMQRIVGISKQVLFVKDPDAFSLETIIGRLGRTTPIRHAEIPIHTKAFEIRESL